MNLKQHIDLAVEIGIPLKTAVKVNYVMGKCHKHHDEDNLSLLERKELKILYEEKLITEKQFKKYSKK